MSYLKVINMVRQFLCLATMLALAAGHGRVVNPPGRSTMWRYGYRTEHNYDDNGLNCGGFQRQYGTNSGRCGVCGDAFDLPNPRPNEIGGIYGAGTIVARYTQGQVITVVLELTAYHMGFFEFRICTDPLNNNQECFDQYLLELEEGGTKFYPWGTATYTLKFRLPPGLKCDHCVLQWKYTCGHNWGICSDGSQGIGCGDQETFWACSDISIDGIARTDTVDAPVEPDT